MRLHVIAILVQVIALQVIGATAGETSERQIGDTRVVAKFPSPPGRPEGIAIFGDKMFVSGPARQSPSGSSDPGGEAEPLVVAYDKNSGVEVARFHIEDRHPTNPEGIVGLAVDGMGRVYIAGANWGVARLDPDTGTDELYANIPNLPTCDTQASSPCAPSGDPGCGDATTSTPCRDQAPLVNDLVFDSDGNLFATDLRQATIWRIPPDGPLPRQAHIWFQDKRLEGVNGIRINPKGNRIFVSVSLPPNAGIYHLRKLARPQPEDLTLLRPYSVEIPDGMAFGASGRLYVVLGGVVAIAVLSSDGEEVARYTDPLSPNPADPRWDGPASVAFNDDARTLLFTHKFGLGGARPQDWVVWDVYVNDTAAPLERPKIR